MTATNILALLERVPFVPFRIHLSNGRAFEVRHRDFLWVFPNRLELAVPADTQKGLIDHTEHISLLHLTRIEELAAA